MPLELGVWRIDQGLVPVQTGGVDFESRLEELLDQDCRIANPGWMIVGRQIQTEFGSRADLLAIDVSGNLILLELKRAQATRLAIAQVLEYGAWVNELRGDDIARIYQDYVTRYHPDRAKESFDEAFRRRFGVVEVPEDLNQQHELVLVGSDLDITSERIVAYLADVHDVGINAIFFRVFRDEGREYLSRVWFRDSTDAHVTMENRQTNDWNGEYYVSYGGRRNWEEARKYGFISGGGGAFYSRTLFMLKPGARVWVNVPGTGYVGVGTVQASAVALEDFTVPGADGKPLSIVTLKDLETAKLGRAIDDPEDAEYLVRVKWLHTVPVAEAVKERGFFGNQNTVAQPRADSWRHTIERLKERWNIAA